MLSPIELDVDYDEAMRALLQVEVQPQSVYDDAGDVAAYGDCFEQSCVAVRVRSDGWVERAGRSLDRERRSGWASPGQRGHRPAVAWRTQDSSTRKIEHSLPSKSFGGKLMPSEQGGIQCPSTSS